MEENFMYDLKIKDLPIYQIEACQHLRLILRIIIIPRLLRVY